MTTLDADVVREPLGADTAFDAVLFCEPFAAQTVAEREAVCVDMRL